MHAVLEVDDKTGVLARLFHELVNACRAIPCGRPPVFRPVHSDRHRLVLQSQMRGLAFFVVGKAERDVGQPVKGQFAIGLGIVDGRVFARFFGRIRISLAMLLGAEQRKPDRVCPHVEPAQHQRSGEAVLGPQRFDIAHFFQIRANGAFAHFFLIRRQLIARAATLYGAERRFGRGLARQHRIVVALDARHVDHADRTAQQGHAGCHHLGHRLIAAFGNRARAVCDPFAALQQLGHHRMMLESLEFHVGEQVRIPVVQMDHETDVNLIVLKVINERTAACVLAQRPTHRVGDRPFAMLVGVDFPDFLHPEAEFLRLLAVREIVFGNHLFRERPAHALGQEHVLAVQFHPRLGVLADGPIRFEPEHTGDNAFHLAIVAVNQFGTGHAGEYLDPQFLGLFGHPAADIAHRHDIVAVIVHQWRHREIGDTDLTGLAQHVEIVVPDRHVQRRAFFLPVGDQRIETGRIQHRARKDMRANFGTLFQHDHVQVRIQLFQANGRRQPRRAGTDDHNVIFHRFAFNLGHVGPLLYPGRKAAPLAKKHPELASPALPHMQSRHRVKRHALSWRVTLARSFCTLQMRDPPTLKEPSDAGHTARFPSRRGRTRVHDTGCAATHVAALMQHRVVTGGLAGGQGSQRYALAPCVAPSKWPCIRPLSGQLRPVFQVMVKEQNLKPVISVRSFGPRDFWHEIDARIA